VIFAIGFGVILVIAAIVSLAIRRRGKAFYSEGERSGPWSVDEQLTRLETQDDTFNRKYR
jgi:hypothetical protein